MNITTKLLITGALLTTSGLLLAQDAPGVSSESHGDPFTPVGDLLVTPTVVQPGVHPEMFWNIEYPQSIPDLVVVNSAGGMTTLNDKSDRLTVRIAGVAQGSERVAVWISVNHGSWNLVFYGAETDVDAGTPVFTTSVQPGTKVDFAVRATLPGGGWSNVQWTQNSSSTLSALIDGSPLPSAVINNGAESFMTQHVGSANQLVTGPRDVIHLFELETEDLDSPEYNLQDIVIVSTFGKSNNGHGNNLDGFDSSNAGSSTGVGGVSDTSIDEETGLYIDDERAKIKRK